ncbi:Phytanoyl-dioxygenase [Pleurostoma richardsiae]|uniref:Phytanoyl-dioxygenase n=1 Tax=Pleurostoma richardsiae TaxID=41990 RepID=A0AA38RE17_9PEZI|nr:Phytanoyl-dioxygenase [Pleurostoma richardsiae]
MGSYEHEPVIDTAASYCDWRDDLIRDGFAVVKGVITPERAQYYLDSLFEWLETFPYGFKKDDKSTWGPANLPAHVKSGMYHGYAVSHEKFFWEARTEPKIVESFAKLWATDDLLVSFDGVNLTLPAPDRPPIGAWPHVDQSPLRRGLQCVQGILNLTPNGPRDGGLIVLKGSSAINEKFFKTHDGKRQTWGPADWFGFTEEEVEWFKARGCEVVKVCAEPGDLILWDSRTVHYNTLPQSDAVRSVLYICYSPASYASAEDLAMKKKLFHDRTGTTHWPHANIYPNGSQQERLGKPETYIRSRPVHEPVESEQVLKLAGVMPY